MAVPSSGPLRLRADIALEVDGSATGTNVSLGTLSDTAGFSAPDAMSDFYSYSAASNITMTLYLGNYISSPSNYLEVYVDGSLYQVANGGSTSYSVSVPPSTSVWLSAFAEDVSYSGVVYLDMYDDYNLFESDGGTIPSLSVNYTTPSSNFNMYVDAF